MEDFINKWIVEPHALDLEKIDLEDVNDVALLVIEAMALFYAFQGFKSGYWGSGIFWSAVASVGYLLNRI